VTLEFIEPTLFRKLHQWKQQSHYHKLHA
jgi:hypothetical protein